MTSQIRTIDSYGIIQVYSYDSADWEAVYGSCDPDLYQTRRETNQWIIDKAYDGFLPWDKSILSWYAGVEGVVL